MPPIDPAVLHAWAVSLHGPVIFPADTAYDSARLVWNRAVDLHPAAIVRCADVDDVRRTIEFAQTQEIRLAVRGGGHSQAGHGTCDGGLVLDLGGFKGIAIDAATRVARVAAGSRVLDVLDATQREGLLTPMGGCPEVGVGGLTLGGGENFLMAKYGAVCDNVVSAEVVTADGRLLTASAGEHADLFWALRGGGGNFGVVTSFEYRLRDVGEVLSGQFAFDVSRARETMLRYRELMADPPDELETSGGLSLLPEGPAFFVALCWCGERVAGDRLVARWRSALRPESDTIKWGPFGSDLAVPAAPSVGTGLFLTELSDEVIEVFASAMSDAPRTANAVWNDFHGAVTRVPLEETAFPLRQRGFDLFISVPWETADDRAHAVAWSGRLAGALRPFSRGVYINNLNDAEVDRIPEAYGLHYARLRAVKDVYDPENLFRINHNIPPASGHGRP